MSAAGGGLLRKGGVLTATAASGLFGARVLGEFIPDALAACVCMFVAGAMGGFVLGVTYRRKLEKGIG